MPISVNRAQPHKSAPKRAAEPTRARKAEETIVGFIRTLERLDSVSTQSVSAPLQRTRNAR